MMNFVCSIEELELILIGAMGCLSKPQTNSLMLPSTDRILTAMSALNEPTSLTIADGTRDGHLGQPKSSAPRFVIRTEKELSISRVANIWHVKSLGKFPFGSLLWI